MELQSFLRDAQAQLAGAGVDNPGLDVRVLAAAVLGCDRAALLTQGDRVLTAAEEKTLTLYIRRRVAREPVARILGAREFWGLNFGLNEATLEPRPDTETLVETALRLGGGPGARLLDLGTGTGAILLSLLHEWHDATGVGVDLAPRAVLQATANAWALGLQERAVFQVGDWLDGITTRFDMVLSNPPYIAADDMQGLMPEVRVYDPLAALVGGVDGLDPYRHLIPQLRRVLNPGGWILFEVGQGQAEAVVALLTAEGFEKIEVVQDLGGVSRCVVGQACPGAVSAS